MVRILKNVIKKIMVWLPQKQLELSAGLLNENLDLTLQKHLAMSPGVLKNSGVSQTEVRSYPGKWLSKLINCLDFLDIFVQNNVAGVLMILLFNRSRPL